MKYLTEALNWSEKCCLEMSEKEKKQWTSSADQNSTTGKESKWFAEIRKQLAPHLDLLQIFVMIFNASLVSRTLSLLWSLREGRKSRESRHRCGICVLTHSHSLEWHRLRLLDSVDYRRLVRRETNKNEKLIAIKIHTAFAAPVKTHFPVLMFFFRCRGDLNKEKAWKAPWGKNHTWSKSRKRENEFNLATDCVSVRFSVCCKYTTYYNLYYYFQLS